jgi:hypothetical protein
METQKVEVIPGLNSVGLIETTYRLEFHNEPSIDNQVCSHVTDVLTAVKDGDDTFRLVRDLTVAKCHLERTMVHGLGVPRTE